MKRKKVYPIKIRKGNVVVTVYRTLIADKERFKVHYFDKDQPKSKAFSDPEVAEQYANDIGDKLNKNEFNPLVFSTGERDEYVTALQYLKPSGISLVVAASAVAQANEILGGRNLIVDAARYYAQKFPVNLPEKTVEEVIEEFLQHRKSRNRSARYLHTIGYHLAVFAGHFQCPIGNITAADLDLFFQDLDLRPKTVNNYIGTVKTLFNFARKRGYLPKDHDEASKIEKVHEAHAPIEVWSPEEMMRLLESAPIEMEPDRDGISNRSRRAFLPCMAIAAFAGLRSQEIQRLDWQDIKLHDGVILVRDVVAGERNKTGKRTAPLLPNLRAWLEPFAKKSGRIWPFCHIHYYDAQRSIAETTVRDELPALEWRHNALRHSFISYRVQLLQNRHTVAEEAGNTPNVIRKHYLEIELPNGRLITKKEAVKWFSIFPDSKLQPIIKDDPQLLLTLLPAVAA